MNYINKFQRDLEWYGGGNYYSAHFKSKLILKKRNSAINELLDIEEVVEDVAFSKVENISIYHKIINFFKKIK